MVLVQTHTVDFATNLNEPVELELLPLNESRNHATSQTLKPGQDSLRLYLLPRYAEIPTSVCFKMHRPSPYSMYTPTPPRYLAFQQEGI